MDTEYIEPTSQSRRRFVLVWLFAVVIGAVAIEAIEAFMDRSKALPICDQITATRSLWTVLLGGMALVGIWVAHLAQRSLQSNQWPLPGTWVLHRTRIYRGTSARRRAYALLAWSVLLLVGSAWSWYAGESFLSRAESRQCSAN